jgi:hypothetical protein
MSRGGGVGWEGYSFIILNALPTQREHTIYSLLSNLTLELASNVQPPPSSFHSLLPTSFMRSVRSLPFKESPSRNKKIERESGEHLDDFLDCVVCSDSGF